MGILTQFNRCPLTEKADGCEKAAAFFLKPMRVAFGRKVNVLKSGDTFQFREQRQSTAARVAMTIVAIITAPIALIGLIFLAGSKSHKKLRNLYVTPQTPKPLLAGSNSAASQVLSSSSSMGGASPSFTPIAPARKNNFWINEAKEKSALEIKQALGEVKLNLKDCYRQFHLDLNGSIFRFMHQEYGVETPNHFIYSLSSFSEGSYLSRPPIPIRCSWSSMELAEGKRYVPWRACVYKLNTDYSPLVPADHSEADVVVHNNDCLAAMEFERDKDRIYVFLDPRFTGFKFKLNDEIYFPSDGLGAKKPSLILKPGDIFECGGYIQFRMKLQDDGTIDFIDYRKEAVKRDIEPLSISEEARLQSSILSGSNGHSRGNMYSSRQNVSEVAPGTPLEKGFYINSRYAHTQGHVERIYVDIDNDLKLQRMVDYLRREFEALDLNEEEKLLRLYSFVNTAIYETNPKYPKTNFYIGEIADSGSGVCRHRGLLFKALADQLDLSVGMLAGLVDSKFKTSIGTLTIRNNGAHLWNVATIGQRSFLIDCMQYKFFEINSNVTQEEREYYGLCT